MFNFGPDNFRSLIDWYFPEPQASLFMGMLLGTPLKSSPIFYSQVKTVGLSHLVVLSGTNITVLAAILASLLSPFGKRAIVLITILTVVGFVIFVSPQAPIIRASFMCIFTLVANITGKKSTTIYLLFLSLVFIVIFWPDWITTVSLQLSYSATLGLIIFSKNSPIKVHSDGRFISQFVMYVKDELKLSLAAQIFTLPIIFYYFRQISLIAPISNLLISWTVAPIMFAGLITLISGSLSYNLGLLPALACYGLLTYVVKIVELLSSIPNINIEF